MGSILYVLGGDRVTKIGSAKKIELYKLLFTFFLARILSKYSIVITVFGQHSEKPHSGPETVPL
jgi:hypothetical protein